MTVTWDLNTGLVTDSREFRVDLQGFKKHSDWNGATLLKQVRQQSFDAADEVAESEDERRARLLRNKSLFALVTLDDEGAVSEVCRFLFDLRIGQTLFCSFPNLLLMDDECTKLYVLEPSRDDPALKVAKFDNTFYEPQMRVGRPTYFSPDFRYRLFVDGESKKIVLGDTLLNSECLTLDIKKHLMFQKKKTHPMIYFHDNDKLVYLTVHGIEKVFSIERTQKRRKTLYALREIANCFYSRKELTRRILVDAYNFKKELVSQVKLERMLQIRGTILKRGLLLNAYPLDPVGKREIQSEYADGNIGNFSYFIVDVFRRELNFSYLAWKMIEQVKLKKLSVASLEKGFVS